MLLNTRGFGVEAGVMYSLGNQRGHRRLMRSGRAGPIVSAVVHVPVPRAGWGARMKRCGRWVPTAAAMGGLLLVYAGWQLFRWPAGHRELFGDVGRARRQLAAVQLRAVVPSVRVSDDGPVVAGGREQHREGRLRYVVR